MTSSLRFHKLRCNSCTLTTTWIIVVAYCSTCRPASTRRLVVSWVLYGLVHRLRMDCGIERQHKLHLSVHCRSRYHLYQLCKSHRPEWSHPPRKEVISSMDPDYKTCCFDDFYKIFSCFLHVPKCAQSLLWHTQIIRDRFKLSHMPIRDVTS